MNEVDKVVSKGSEVLFIGPDYRNHRGGIGAVLAIYANHIYPFKFVPSFKPVNSIVKALVFVKGLMKFFAILVKDKSIKIVHIHASHGASVYRKFFFLLFGKYLFNKKLIYHLHSSSYDKYYKNGNAIYKFFCKVLINNSDTVIVLSPSWYEFIISNFNPKRIEILNNVIEPNELERKSDIRNSNPISFLFLGRIGERKGVFDLVEVVNRNKEALKSKVHFLLGGDGEVDRLQTFIKENKLQDLISYIGWVDGERKLEVLLKSDVLLLPSYNEGLPISILEAMDIGLPIISTTVGGIPQVVKTGSNGILIHPGNQQELYTAIKQYVDCPKDIVDHGKQSTVIIKDYYPTVVFGQLQELYKKVI